MTNQLDNRPSATRKSYYQIFTVKIINYLLYFILWENKKNIKSFLINFLKIFPKVHKKEDIFLSDDFSFLDHE